MWWNDQIVHGHPRDVGANRDDRPGTFESRNRRNFAPSGILSLDGIQVRRINRGRSHLDNHLAITRFRPWLFHQLQNLGGNSVFFVNNCVNTLFHG